MRQIRVKGDIDLSPHVASRHSAAGAKKTEVHGSIVLTACDVAGRVDLRGVHINGRLHLPLAHIRDRITACCWIHPHDWCADGIIPTEIIGRDGVAVRMADSVVEHGVWMSGANLKGQFNAKNARIGGDLYLRRARGEELELPATDHEAPGYLAEIPRTTITVDGQSGRDAIRLLGADIKGSVELDDASLVGGLNLDNVTIGGDLLAQGIHIVPGGHCRDGPSVAEGEMALVSLRTSKVGRTLDFGGANIAGGLDLRGTRIEGNCRFGAWRRVTAPAADWQGREAIGQLDLPLPTEQRGQFDLPLLPGEQRPTLTLERLAADAEKTFNQSVPRERELGRWQPGEFQGQINLTGLRVEASVFFGGGLYVGAVDAEGIYVGNVLDFTGGVFLGSADFDDAEVKGELLAGHDTDARKNGGTSDDVTIEWTDAGTYFADVLTLRRTEIRGDFRYKNLAVGWAPEDARATLAEASRQRAAVHPPTLRWWAQACAFERLERRPATPIAMLNLRLATIEGNWMSPRHPTAHPKAPEKDCRWLLVEGTLTATNLKVSGGVELCWASFNGDLKMENAVLGDDLHLDGSRVTGDLRLGGTHVEGKGLSHESHSERVLRNQKESTATATRASERTLPGKEDHQWEVAGALDLHGAKFDELWLILRPKLEHGPDSIDLRQLEVRELRVRGNLHYTTPPFIDMTGMRFEELDVEDLGPPLGSSKGARRQLREWLQKWRDQCYSVMTNPDRKRGILFAMRQMPRLDARLIGWIMQWFLDWCEHFPERFKRFFYNAPTRPQGVAFFLRQMPELDTGLFAHAEQWLRRADKHAEADGVYLERRLQEFERSLFHFTYYLSTGLVCLALARSFPLRNSCCVGILAAFIVAEVLLTIHCRQQGDIWCFLALALSTVFLGNRAIFLSSTPQSLIENAALRLRNASQKGAFPFRYWKEPPGPSVHECDDEGLVGIVIKYIGSWVGECVRRIGRILAIFFDRIRLWWLADGVSMWRLVLCLAVLFTISWTIFSDGESVEHPATFLAKDTTLEDKRSVKNIDHTKRLQWIEDMGDAKEIAHEEVWGVSDGFWTALSIHVPLVQFVARDEWQPASRPIKWPEAAPEWMREWISFQYDTWAGIMQILGWIGVPLVVTAATGVLKKR